MIDPAITKAIRAAVPDAVGRIATELARAGHRTWIVGGIVRDFVRAVQERAEHHAFVGDWDLATSARPEVVLRTFRRAIPTGVQHGTVTVMMGKVGYEVTTLRGETTYSDGRHPDSVFFVDDIIADLARRDFTINALAFDLLCDKLLDPFGGVEDLARMQLRAVGDPAERFAEDGLRVLRAARFVATLGVALEPATAAAILPSLASFRRVSAERIRDEWLKALAAPHPSRAFEVMREHGMLAITAPELMALVGCEQNRHHAFDVWKHTLHCVDACPPRPLLRLAALLHDVAKPETRAIGAKTSDYTFYDHEQAGARIADRFCSRLRLANEERAYVTALVRHHLVAYDPSWSDAALRRWLRRITSSLWEDVLTLSRADVVAKGRDATEEIARLDELAARTASLLRDGTALTVRDLAVDGNDLMAELRLPAGRQIGDLLRSLLEHVTDLPSDNHRARLLELARALVARKLADPSGAKPVS
ncbi:MAG: HD domain-containing protein [Polyangiaceae bacterium]|nr:HD domain-containing protein [Polyangiaceae bacterium]